MNVQKSIWDGCTNLYSLQKTLRFELKPVGKTIEFINQKHIIEEDEELAKKFNKAKKIIDDCYKFFIEDRLKKVKIEEADLKKFNEIYKELKQNKGKDKKIRGKFSEIQKKIRNDLHKKFFNGLSDDQLFGKKFFTDTLPNWLQSNNRERDILAINDFKKWTTYFTGFFDNRRNVFSKDEIHTSFIYRIVHDNLPKYIDNLERYDKLKKYSDFNCKQLVNDFSSELQGEDLSKFFTLEKFNECLSQPGIERFNLIIGGKSLEGNRKIPGLNEVINLYSQNLTNEENKRAVRKLFMLPLFKQILSDRTSASFILSAIEDDAEVISIVNELYSRISKDFELFQSTFKGLTKFNTSQIYINKALLNEVSNQIYDDWSILENSLKCFAKEKLKLNTEKKIDEWLKKSVYFSLDEIKQGIEFLKSENVTWEKFIEHYNLLTYDNKPLIDAINENYNAVKGLDLKKNEKKLLTEQKEADVTKIKQFLDSVMNLYHFLKPFNMNQDFEKETIHVEVDTEFYKDFNDIYSGFAEVIPVYNKVRNYVTQKTFSTNKFKLNFKNSTLLQGWDKNKESDNWSALFQKDGNYFLGIMSEGSGNNKLFKKKVYVANNVPTYRKIVYKLLQGPNKMLPKVFFSKKNIGKYNPSENILRIRNHSTYTKNGTPQDGYTKKEFSLADCHKMIDFYKDCIKKHKEWNEEFDFKFRKTSEYTDISEFYKDVADQGYKITYEEIPDKIINEYVDTGKLYLFQIWSKDFSPFSKGRKNLHTLYWQELFSPENLRDVRFKLNGEAEVFFRRKSIDPKITHPKNKPILNRNPIREKKESNFSYDLIKNRRYTEDKFFFHCPVTLNFKSKGSDNSKSINSKINEIVKKNPDVNILSIDRGERHLLYCTLLNLKGEILKQKSFNMVFDDVQREHSYHDKLDTLEKERQAARKAWKTIHNIKELKSGYLSQVVHQISKIAIEDNAVIILEDLNFGFKKGRFKIEKQVYQKFEKMLIEKLNYLNFKERLPASPGGVLNAYQLTSKFDSFKKLGKQTGLLYYVDANYTSKICPKTGFVNLLYPKYTNLNSAIEFFNKFKSINYNEKENYFEFKFRYADFLENDQKSEYNKKEWTICSFGKRFITIRNNSTKTFETSELNLTDELRKLFSKNNISFEDCRNIKEQICSKTDKDFFERLLYLFRSTLQLRNTNSKNEEDFILSCVKDESGDFFDSRKAKNDEPKNSDANGAYHIGLKGLLTIKKIKNGEENIRVDKNEYLDFVINKKLKNGR